jgi:hypothetical protein
VVVIHFWRRGTSLQRRSDRSSKAWRLIAMASTGNAQGKVGGSNVCYCAHVCGVAWWCVPKGERMEVNFEGLLGIIRSDQRKGEAWFKT